MLPNWPPSFPKLSLRQMLARGDLIEAPGVGDALTALQVEEAGFPCVYMSGYQVCASLGHSDIGLVTQTEMVARAASICAAIGIPLIADADNGHGNALGVIRTIRELERVGVTAIHLEDQSLPKRCAAMAGIELIDVAEMCGKVAAACEARRNRDFMVFARTDALNSTDMDDAIRRGRAYRAAGADGLMLQSPRSPEELIRFREAVEGPLMVTMGSWALQVTATELHRIGYQVVLFPLTTMRRALAAVAECLAELRSGHGLDHSAPTMAPMSEFDRLLRLSSIRAREAEYGDGNATGGSLPADGQVAVG